MNQADFISKLTPEEQHEFNNDMKELGKPLFDKLTEGKLAEVEINMRLGGNKYHLFVVL